MPEESCLATPRDRYKPHLLRWMEEHLERMLRDTSAFLAQLTDYAAVVVPPPVIVELPAPCASVTRCA